MGDTWNRLQGKGGGTKTAARAGGNDTLRRLQGKPAVPTPKSATTRTSAEGERGQPSTTSAWLWRNRLRLAACAVPLTAGAVWAGQAVTDPRAVARGVHQWQVVLHWLGTRPGAQYAGVRGRWPTPTVPIPADWAAPFAAAGLKAVLAVAVTVLLWCVKTGRWGRLRHREAGWAEARRVEAVWAEAMWTLGHVTKGRWFGAHSIPELVDVRLTEWGGFEGRVRAPKGINLDDLAKDDIDAVLRRELDLGRKRGTCEQIAWTVPKENKAKWRGIRLVFQGLPDPSTLPVDLGPAPDDSHFRIGISDTGVILWDLPNQPFLRVSGSSGRGKGIWARWVISQAVQRGMLVLIIDGAGAPEHERWKDLPNVWYYPLDLDDPDAALGAFAGQLSGVRRICRKIRKLCTAATPKRDSWAELDALMKRQWPRVLIVFDEFTSLVGKAPEEDDTRDARKRVAFLINRMMRLYRKYGVNALLADQITYAGTWVGSDGIAQATQLVWCGMPNPRQQTMLSAGTHWPDVPNLPGYGLVCVVGDKEAQPIVWPHFKGSHVDDLVATELALWAEHRTLAPA